MFEIGFTEILLILGIALLVLGPEKLPGLARKVGRWAGQARGMARQFREQLDDEVLRHEREWDRPTPRNRPAATSGAAAEPAAGHPVSDDTEPVLATIPDSAREPAPDPDAGTGELQNPRSDSPASAPATAALRESEPSPRS